MNESEQHTFLNNLTDSVPWCIDSIKLADNTLEIKGWAISPDGDTSLADFTFNNNHFEDIFYPLIRQNIGKLFWYIPDAILSGFVCRSLCRPEELEKTDEIVFNYLNKRTQKPFHENHWYAYSRSSDKVPFPPINYQQKQIGTANESLFNLKGYTLYKKIGHALKKIANKDYNDFDNLLEVGCGCGMSSRHVDRVPHLKFTGIDFDNDAITWCQDNLNVGNFRPVSPRPPTDLNASEYDLLTGMTIFTHFAEPLQFKWLEELYRVAKQDAVLLIAVRGDASIARSGFSAEMISSWEHDGFLDVRQYYDPHQEPPASDYNRNVLHHADYINEKWSDYFEILDIVPGYLDNHLDLVVLRKP